MSKLNFKSTPVLEKLLNTDKRFVLSVGSSRSSKTYSMYQWIIIYCAKNKDKGKYISIVRKSFPFVRKTVLREFVDLLTEYGLYSSKNHNKTEQKIRLFGNWIEFFSVDSAEKVRGAKRDILFINEANEIDYETGQQLFLRTTERVFMDENPSDIWHWSMKYQHRDDCDYLHSTYKDNSFLTQATIDQIEGYKELDDNFYRVFGLGLPGYALTTIYTKYGFYKDRELFLEGNIPLFDDFCYGLDVGYSHKMALVKTYFKDDTVWAEEVIYRSSMTAADLVTEMINMGIEQDKDIWVDAAAPAMIQDLIRAGFNARPAIKSVKEGIDLVRSKKLLINGESINLIDEIRRYNWKTKGEQIIYEPVKANDDLCDAMRYSIFNYYKDNSTNDYTLLF